MRTLIIEDEPQAISALKKELQLSCPEVDLVGVAQNVKDGVQKISEQNPELVFLDIQLSDGLGFDILQELKVIDFKVIFTTAYSEYALKAIKFSALDYLLKPIDSSELRIAVDKARVQDSTEINKKINVFSHNQRSSARLDRIALQTSEGISIHEVSKLIRCQAKSNYTHLFFEDGFSLLVTKTLKEFEELLSLNDFERIHHSHLINMSHLRSFVNKDGGYVIMSNKSTLPVSQRKRSRFIKRLNDFNL